jgi:hypothetical protein
MVYGHCPPYGLILLNNIIRPTTSSVTPVTIAIGLPTMLKTVINVNEWGRVTSPHIHTERAIDKTEKAINK